MVTILSLSARLGHRLVMTLVASLFIASGFSALGQEPGGRGTSLAPAIPGDGSGIVYRILTNDVVEISVYREKDLDSRVRVDGNGVVFLPLIERVAIGGRTVEDARRLLQDLYEKDFLVKPQVILTVVESSATNKVAVIKRFYSVLGQVKNPGDYEIPEGEKVDLVRAIAKAGDFTRIAKKKAVSVKRTVGNREQVFLVDAEALIKDQKAKSFEILPGDIIQVNETLF